MVGQITSLLAKYKFNILNMVNKSKLNLAYNILDFDNQVDQNIINELLQIPGVIKARII